MPIQLPNFSGSSCFYLSICGVVRAAGAQLPDAFRGGEKWHTAGYERSEVPHVIRVGWKPSVDGESAHLHFDITTQAYFTQRQLKPRIDVPPQEIERLVAAVIGRTYDGDATSHYELPAGSFPQLIRHATESLRVKTDDIEIELKGCELAIKGAPVHGIKWTQSRHSSGIELTLVSKAPPMIGEDLLVRTLAQTELAYRSLNPQQVADHV